MPDYPLILFPAKAGTHRAVALNFSSNRMVHWRRWARAAEQWTPAFVGESILVGGAHSSQLTPAVAGVAI